MMYCSIVLQISRETSRFLLIRHVIYRVFSLSQAGSRYLAVKLNRLNFLVLLEQYHYFGQSRVNSRQAASSSGFLLCKTEFVEEKIYLLFQATKTIAHFNFKFQVIHMFHPFQEHDAELFEICKSFYVGIIAYSSAGCQPVIAGL